jgi:hypothetical protein
MLMKARTTCSLMLGSFGALSPILTGIFGLETRHRQYLHLPSDLKISGVLLPSLCSGSSLALTLFVAISAAFYRAEQAEPLVLAGKRPAFHPKTHNLLINYRSHRGITNVAATLVDLVVALFPSAIDRLGRETGIVEGTLPVIFDKFEDSSDLKVESFLFGAGDTTMEFGGSAHLAVYSN